MRTNPGLIASALKTLRTVSRKKHARSALKDLHDPAPKSGPFDGDDSEEDDDEFDVTDSPFVSAPASPPSALTRLSRTLPRNAPNSGAP